MANLVLLVVCFALGILAKRFTTLPAQTPRVLNTWVLYVSLPALVLKVVHSVKLEATVLLSASSMWLVFAVPAAFALVARARGVSAKTAGAIGLCAGLGNTAFVGLPMLEALGGKEAVGPTALVDQLGSFVAFSLLAVPFATVMGGAKPTLRQLGQRVATFPPFAALALALLLRPLPFPELLDQTLGRLADVMSPLALASVGWQLNLSQLKGQGGKLALGLGWKLALAPAVVMALVWVVHGPFGLLERVTVVQAAMAPMVTAGVLAAEHGLEPELCAGFVGVGVPVSFLTVPLWWKVTELLAS
jgi:hypothetical protein